MRTIVVMSLVGVIAARSAAHAAPGELADGDTLERLLEGEAIGMGIGGGVGLISGLLIANKASQKPSDLILGAVFGIAGGMVLGVPVGMHIDATLHDGTGHWWGTTLGTLAGFAAATGIGLTVRAIGKTDSSERRTAASVGVIAIIGCVFAGPIIGYRLSGDGPAPNTTALVVPFTIAF